MAGDYATYLERKADAMAAQEKQEQALRNTLRSETEWLRRGPKARSRPSRRRASSAPGSSRTDVAELGARNRTRSADIELEGSGRRTQQTD